ncbi:hypothetical protein BK708_37545 [Bacillus thuringiensis serovar yunnanensis]|nr:hypothetical protein BK708_37545 [Bacillus thuringiensis serovar yunnanensis]
MKKYKKLAVAMPLAGMIMSGVGVLGGPASSFADMMPQAKIAAMHTTLAANTMNENAQLQKDLSNYFGGEVSNIQVEPIIDSNTTPRLEITKATPTDPSSDTIELASNHNISNVFQTYKTPEKKVTTTTSLEITNEGEFHTGLKSETTFKMGVPFFGEGEEKVTAELDVTYKRGSVDKTEKSTEITYPSQTINCAPGGTTTLISKVQETLFEGKYTGKAVITGFDVKHADGTTRTFNPLAMAVYEAAQKVGGKELPSSVESNKDGLIVKNMTTTFTGKAGHTSQAEIKFIPDDKSKQSVTMPLAEYNQKVAAGISLYAK